VVPLDQVKLTAQQLDEDITRCVPARLLHPSAYVAVVFAATVVSW
jgi:hypothetical protein